jgi:glycosyltransferase involved in cell wall biosynthesis
MRILIATPEFPPKVGGMGRSAYRIGRAFVDAGHATTILTYDRSVDTQVTPYTKIECSNDNDLRVLRVGPIAAKRTGVVPQVKATLKRQFVAQSLRTIQECPLPEIVFSLGLIDAGFVGLCISQTLGCPHVVSARGADVGTEIFQSEKFPLAQWVISRSSAVTFVNKYLFEVATAVFGRSNNQYIIKNGIADIGEITAQQRERWRIEMRDRLSIPLNAEVIGWTGTFRQKKGIQFLDQAFRILVSENRNVYLLIVGGPRNEIERALCPSLDDTGDFGKRIRRVGLVEKPTDVYPYYASMDTFMYPSLDDGMSNSILEAMAFGLPVVATDIFADVATHNETALLVQRFDALALANGARQLLDDYALRKSIGDKARDFILREFTSDKERDAYLVLFNELIDSHSSQAV